MDVRKKQILILLLIIFFRRKMKLRRLHLQRLIVNNQLRNSVEVRQKIAKILYFYEETVPLLTPRYFRRYFRMYRPGLKAVTDYLKRIPLMQENAETTRVPIDKQVSMCMTYLGSKSTTISLAHLFGLSEERFLTITEKVLDALISNISNIIKWPEKNMYRYIANKFNNIGKHYFPNVIGCIDGCHLEIELTEEIMNAESYNNYHGWNSLILQGTCTYDLTFIYLEAGWPGRASDAGVFNKSSLKPKLDDLMEFGNRDLVNSFHIVGDSAFPIQKSLLIPYKCILGEVLDPVRSFFNKCLSSKRQNIERAFGLLLKRFPRISKLNQKTLRKKIKVILAACILHNMCIWENDNIEYFLRTAIRNRRINRCLLNNLDFDEDTSKADGVTKRNLICARLYNRNDDDTDEGSEYIDDESNYESN